MPNYAIMRLEKRKLGSVTRICNHHERLKEQYKSNPDIDIERSYLNYHLVQPEDKYRPLVLERIEEAGALLGRYAPEMAKLKTQLKSADNHIDYLEKEISRERSANRSLEKKNDEQEVDIKWLNRDIYELNAKQKN